MIRKKLIKNLIKLFSVPVIITFICNYFSAKYQPIIYSVCFGFLWTVIVLNHLDFISESNENAVEVTKIHDNVNIIDRNTRVLKNDFDKLKIIVDKNAKTKEKINNRNKTTRSV